MKKVLNLQSLRHAQYLVASRDYPEGIGEAFYINSKLHNYPLAIEGWVFDCIWDKYAMQYNDMDFVAAQGLFENTPTYETALHFWATYERYNWHLCEHKLVMDIEYVNEDCEYDFQLA